MSRDKFLEHQSLHRADQQNVWIIAVATVPLEVKHVQDTKVHVLPRHYLNKVFDIAFIL